MHNWGYALEKVSRNLDSNLRHLPTHMVKTQNINANQNIPSRVLVIDNDTAMSEMLDHILEPDEFELYVAHSGKEGIEASKRLDPDVIILDLLISDMGGWEICKEIRSFCQSPILVVSAVSKPGMVAKALDEGADDFLLKPMTSSVLMAHLKRMAWRVRAEREAKNSNKNFCEA